MTSAGSSSSGSSPQPWQGTAWDQMDPAYQQYVKTALGVTGSDPQAQKNFDRLLARGTLSRALGSSQPDLGPQLNPYQSAAQAGWGSTIGLTNGGEVGLGQPVMPWGGNQGPFSGSLYQPMSYAEWQALRLPTGGGGGTTPPPGPGDETNGLLPQMADPFAAYGQMGVMEPYLTALNQRFGWDPTGVAYGQALNPALPTWYQPKTIYPETILPKIKGGTNPYSWTG